MAARAASAAEVEALKQESGTLRSQVNMLADVTAQQQQLLEQQSSLLEGANAAGDAEVQQRMHDPSHGRARSGSGALTPENSSRRLSGGLSASFASDRRGSGGSVTGGDGGAPSPGKADWQSSLRGGGVHMNHNKPTKEAQQVAAARKSYGAQARAKATTPPPQQSGFMPTVFRPQSSGGGQDSPAASPRG